MTEEDPEIRRMRQKLERDKAEFTTRQQEIEARLKAQRENIEAQNRALADSVNERLAHMPRHLDTADDRQAMINAAMKRLDIRQVRNETTIYKWDDGYGNIIYLSPNIPLSQIHEVSSRILAQAESFAILNPDDQSKVQTEFTTSKGTSPSSQPFKDFLSNQALEKRFNELQSSTTSR